MTKKRKNAKTVPSRTERPNPRIQLMEIEPADVGKKFLRLGVEFEAPVTNREVDPVRVSNFASDGWDAIQGTDIHLLLQQDGKAYSVLDGHHRLHATMQRDEPGTFRAHIYEWGTHVFNDEDVLWLFNQYSRENSQSYRADDRLYTLRMHSPWLPVFAGYDVDVKFQRGGWKPYQWSRVLAARWMADRLTEHVADGTSPTDFRPTKISILRPERDGRNPMRDMWLTAATDIVAKTANALQAWQKVILAGRPQRVTTLWGTHCIGLFLSVWDCAKDPEVLDEALRRMVCYIDPLEWKGLGPSGQFDRLVRVFMKTLNFKRRTRIIEYGGITR